MSSNPAVLHKENMAKAYAAMENLGVPRKKCTPFIQNLLKVVFKFHVSVLPTMFVYALGSSEFVLIFVEQTS
jgi:hypothetical protein